MEKLNEFPLPKDVEVLQKAIDTYGKEAQVDMAIEEMSELTKALLKERRAKPIFKADYTMDIFEEMADVIIMLNQLLMIFCHDNNVVQTYIDEKVERLAKRLGESSE